MELMASAPNLVIRTEYRLNGIFPKIGTIVGPDWTGMYFTVHGIDELGCTLRRTVKEDYEKITDEPHSLTERNLIRLRRANEYSRKAFAIS